MRIGEDILRGLLDEKGILKGMTRKSLVVDCPACGREKRVYIFRDSGRSKCMGCKQGWTWKGIVADLLGVSIPEVSNMVIGSAPEGKLEQLPSLLQESSSAAEITDADFQDDEEPLVPFYFDPTFIPVEKSVRAVEYLLSRGADKPEIWVRHDLMYQAGRDGIVAPIKLHGIGLGYQCRYISPVDPKNRMKSSDDLPRARVIYNYDNARNEKRVILVEGLFDCLKVDMPGQYGGLATLGNEITEDQISLMLEAGWEEFYNGLDPDAYKEALELEQVLAKHMKVYRILPPKGRKDFGACSEQEVLDSLSRALEGDGTKTGRLEVFLSP